MNLRLHSYWRSGAAWRVRIALAIKGLDHATITHDLRRGAQRDGGYLAINPQGLVPAVQAGSETLTQSLAILEWLEERYPAPALLPAGIAARARVRAMAQVIACDIHPLNNLRVLSHLRDGLGATEDQVSAWIARWISEGFGALEQMVAGHGGQFASGDTPTIADCCLVPQVYSARRFGVDMAAFPAIAAVDRHCSSLAPFLAAAPASQPDGEQ